MFDPIPFFKIPSDVEQEELAGGLRVSRELSHLTHLMHYLSQRMERVRDPDIISSSR